MREPAVSVIIPFLDGARFLEEAVASVLAQAYSDWELLLVDDGSADGAPAIAREHAGREPRIRCLEHPGRVNRGVSASRNLGLAHARGEYIAFLDADDVWLPHKLEQQVAILEAEPRAAMVYGATEYWHSWSQDPATDSADAVLGPGIPTERLYEPPQLLIDFLEYRAMIPPPSDPLFRAAAARSVRGFQEDVPALVEDQAFYAKICLSRPVHVASACWDRYRQHPDSLCGRADAAMKQAARRAYVKWLESYLEVRSVQDPGVRRALRRHETRRGRHWRIWRRLARRLRR